LIANLIMPSLPRRKVLLSLALSPFVAIAAPATATADLAALERELHGEIGLAAIDSATGRLIGYRRDQRFPLCSTFKALLAAAILARTQREPGLLDKRLPLPFSTATTLRATPCCASWAARPN
jgi:beta-lactamase class A